METDLPISKKVRMESDSETFMKLPYDYNNWSSTVIFFQENTDDISVYAFDCDECIVYYVVSYERMNLLYMEMGYTAGDFKVYFVGDAIVDDEHCKIICSREVKVYDIPSRQWKHNLPKLNSPKTAPFVFFHDEKLYVLSCGWARQESQFEVLDINNYSQGWVTLSRPSFLLHKMASKYSMVFDSSMKMLYISLDEFCYSDRNSTIYGYDLHDDKWHIYDWKSSLSGRTSNLWNSNWSSSSIIAENYLYSFSMCRMCMFGDDHYNDLRAILFVCDLDQEVEVHNNSVECNYVDEIHSNYRTTVDCDVDISHVIAPEVLLDSYATGNLVYLGKYNSCPRFSLIIVYCDESCSQQYHVCTCTFELRRKSKNLDESAARESSTELFTANTICCRSSRVKMVPGALTCNKLCKASIVLKG